MMKTKLAAGLVATLLTLVFIVGAAILMVTAFDMDSNDRFVKIIAFGAIAIWLGLFGWLKPKTAPVNIPTQENKPAEKETSSPETERNSYR